MATLQDIMSSDGLRALGTAVATAGLTHELQMRWKIPIEPKTFGEFVQMGAMRSGISTVVDIGFGNTDVQTVLEGGLRGFAANTLPGYAAHHIGASYMAHHLDPITHELLHGLAGGGAGALLNPDDPLEGAKAGAIGSMAAEAAAGFINMSVPRPVLTTQTDLAAYGQELQHQADMARLIGASTAFAFGQNVSTAAVTAGTAVEFNFRASHVAEAEADLAEREAQQVREWERDAEEEMARIPALEEALEFLSDTKDLLLRPPSPPIVDLGEAEIVKNVRAGLVKDTRIDLQREWGGYDVPLTGVPNISAETKADARKVYEYAKRHDPQFAWVAQTVEDLPAEIERGVHFLKEERERSAEGFERFVAERSWESFSARDTLGTVAFGMCDAMGEDVARMGKALGYVGTGIEYGKSYMRRGLRDMGVSPIVAQSVVNGAEGVAVIKGAGNAARGVAAWRESRIFVGEAGAPGASDFPEFAHSSRADKIPVWDVRGSGPKGGNLDQLSRQGYRPLLEGEGKVGTYGELKKQSAFGDHLTPNHIPQSAYIQKYGVAHKDGISMMMEHPFPGAGGRHRFTRTYGRQPDLSISPRGELARDIWDIRQIYKTDGVYIIEIHKALQEVISRNKLTRSDVFLKTLLAGTE